MKPDRTLVLTAPRARRATRSGRSLVRICLALVAASALLFGLASSAQATICTIGPGAALPPVCSTGYLSPQDVHMIIDGLPAGTTILVGAEHFEFFNIVSGPGGNLGGEFEQFHSSLRLNLEGTGMLAGYNRTVFIPNVQTETHIGPRNPGDPVQSFDTDMFALQGQITGDPDFDLLRITAGTGFGMPSPGHTTLTQVAGGNFNVDSFFDIEYRIDFVGAPGGPLAGRSGSTTATIRMAIGEPIPEPSTIALAAMGLVGLAGAAYRRRRSA